MPTITRNAFRLDINLDRKNLARLDRLASISKLTATKALTFTAEKAIPAWQAANARVFKMRRDWINRGVRMRAATPGNLNAQVGSIDRYMGRHTVGVGEPKRAGALGRLLVPLMPAAQQGTHTQFRARLRSADSSARKLFKMQIGGKTFLARRTGRSRNGIEFLGEFMPEVHIKQRLDALGVVDGVVNREFGKVYERVLLRALEGKQAAV